MSGARRRAGDEAGLLPSHLCRPRRSLCQPLNTFPPTAPAEWAADLEVLCADNPHLVGCSLAAQCKVRREAGNSPEQSRVRSKRAACAAPQGSSLLRCRQAPTHAPHACMASALSSLLAAPLQNGEADGPYCDPQSLVGTICGMDSGSGVRAARLPSTPA